jgi:2-polyprenyl-3-methyl-5-hydroxy-6-metoxy-1,4-benzoquinol methylase
MHDETKLHSREIRNKERFTFGENWNLFAGEISAERVAEAEESLKTNLGCNNLLGLRFLDIGCGSGIFSLAARRLGASVTAFDYDPKSVACALALRKEYFGEEVEKWNILEGSVLDRRFIEALGQFDIVYSWGVLHHTGDMWSALENSLIPLSCNAKLFISIYNDQGYRSKLWKFVKKGYINTPKSLRQIYAFPFLVGLWGPAVIRDFIYLRPFKTWIYYKKNRGMSPYRDLIDWVGGYPFEVASPSEIFSFYKSKGLTLDILETCAGRHGCNEFVFTKKS